MQDGMRDSKPGVGARNVTAQATRVIDMARMPTGEYRAVMADLFATAFTTREGFTCTTCPDGRPHRHAR
jgi:hypothetical protein